jgi:hypothetical protein
MIFISSVFYAQDACVSYLPDESTKMTYINYDKKGKEESTTTTEVKSVKTVGDTTYYKVHQLVSTGKKKNDYETDFKYRCEGNKFVIDMKSVLNSEMMAPYQDASVVVETDNMSIPSTLEAGMELEDGKIDVMVKMDYLTTNIKARVFYREVLGQEEVTTPAGTFNAWKIEGNVESKVTFMRVAVRTVEWYVRDVGIVRSETYDNKGKLIGYSELQNIQ